MRLSDRAINGAAWTLGERVSVQLIQFVIGIVLARLLAPEAYGLVGMLAVFLALAQLLIDSGFGNALIRKKERTEADYSTVFYFNLAVSLALYAILYVSAPFIASFYNIPELKEITRIISITVILNAIALVPTAKFTSELNFKSQAIASIASVIGSGVLGIWMAFKGFGVWALVGQSIALALLKSIILLVQSRWMPKLCFSRTSFREMFSYGSRLLAGGFIHTIYTNLYTILIGKFFNATDTGYYNRANMYGILPNSIYIQTVSKVLFPVLSQQQDDDALMLQTYKKSVKASMAVYVPLLFGMAVLSSQLIEILIGPKWLPCAPLLQVLCIGYAISPLSTLNLNLLYVKGRSDLTLKLDIIKKSIGIAILFATLPLGLWWMCVGKALYEVVAFCLNCHYTGKIFKYGLLEQFKDVLPSFIKSILMLGLILLILHFTQGVWLQLILGFLCGTVLYFILSLVFNDGSLELIKNMICRK